MGAAEAIEPGVELTLAELGGLMALGTCEVVVMFLAAVAHLAGRVNERVGFESLGARTQAESPKATDALRRARR